MLILNQYKNEIVNLSNVTNIFTHFNGKIIKCMLTSGGESYIGEYATEERAKEVLQEITKAYKESGSVKIDNVQAENKVVYEMPEK